MEKLLVTGAGGFIGSHLVEQLVNAGYKVRALVRYNSANDLRNLKLLPNDILTNVEVVFGDVTDARLVDKVVEGCSVVLHLAALIGIPYSYIAPISYVRVNVEGTMNVLEACRRNGIKRLIHTSTSEVYGTALYEPIDEKHSLQGQSPYSATKIAADKLVESYYLSFGLPAVTIRPFNTFGPRQSNRAVIPTIINQLLAHPDYLEIGALYPKRDFTFVDDTVRGFMAAIKTPNIEGETINLGLGETYSVKEVVNIVSEYLGANPDIHTQDERLRPDRSEVKVLISNNKKAVKLLGWCPEVSFADGLRRVIDYLREHPVTDGIDNYTV